MLLYTSTSWLICQKSPVICQLFPTNPNHSKPAGILATHQPHQPPKALYWTNGGKKLGEALWTSEVGWSSRNHVLLHFSWWICFGKKSLLSSPARKTVCRWFRWFPLMCFCWICFTLSKCPIWAALACKLWPPLFDLYPCCLKDDEFPKLVVSRCFSFSKGVCSGYFRFHVSFQRRRKYDLQKLIG